MSNAQVLILNKRKFALIPYKEYESLIDTIEELKALDSTRKRKNEERIPIGEVKKKLPSKSSISSEQVKKGIAQGLKDIDEGRVVPWEEVRARLKKKISNYGK